MKRFVRLSAVASFVLCLTFLLASCNAPVALRVLPAHADDQVGWLADPLPMFEVRCRAGIGSALVEPVERSWPDSFNVVLELAALEGFVVRSGEEVHRLEVTRDGRVLLEPADSRVLHMNHLQAMGKTSRFSIRVNPKNFADTASEVHVEWVDYYR